LRGSIEASKLSTMQGRTGASKKPIRISVADLKKGNDGNVARMADDAQFMANRPWKQTARALVADDPCCGI
jgi:hypothetical protein